MWVLIFLFCLFLSSRFVLFLLVLRLLRLPFLFSSLSFFSPRTNDSLTSSLLYVRVWEVSALVLGPALGKEKRSRGSSEFGSVRLDAEERGNGGKSFFGLVWFGLLGFLLGGG